MAILHAEFAKDMISDQESESIEKIRQYILQNRENEYENILAEDGDWDVFFHLSQMRTSLLNWYEFEEHASLLEIGGNLGALTGLFCDRCEEVVTVEKSLVRATAICERYKNRNNLNIYAGSVEDISLNKKFDYVVAIGILGSQDFESKDLAGYANFVRKISEYLKPDGKLLIAEENRYGIRYFCGVPDSRTGKPFDGINQYPESKNRYSFSKQELIEILKGAGFENYKFYYPLPDYKLTQVVYSDEYSPQGGMRDKVIPYYTTKDSLVAVEADIYDDLVKNNVFEFFSNSYLVECGAQSDFCSVVYAVLSTDRGKEHGLVTAIHENHTVSKRALYEEGQESIKRNYDNIIDLQKHGVGVVPHELRNNTIYMPYVTGGSLMDFLSKEIERDKTHFVKLLDELYDNIIRSSVEAAPEKNALQNAKSKDVDWGIVLENAYIDMVPMNCFYKDGQFLFYDQEFLCKNYPAKYIMFRVLLYTYIFITNANHIIPQKELIKRYGLEDVWDICMDEEGKFISDNRNHRVYHYFYEWSNINKSEIWGRWDKRELKVQHDQVKTNEEIVNTEIEDKYVKTIRLENIQKIELKLLKKLKEVCEKYQLTFYLFYGSLLGAVRDGGMIPWDDDVDVVMPRKDYEKLKQVSKEAFSEEFFFQTPESDGECFYGGYGKLRYENSTGIELRNWKRHCSHGIWIDIMPLDNYDMNQVRRKKQLNHIRNAQRLLAAKNYKDNYDQFWDMPSQLWNKYTKLSHLFSKKKLLKCLDRALKEANDYNSEFVAVLSRYATNGNYCFFEKEFFGEPLFVDFEGEKFPIPRQYDKCLNYLYGPTYMQWPAAEHRISHHRVFWNTNVPYSKYAERFWNLFDNLEGKTIVIFGAGEMFKDYLKKYGKQYSPSFVVDNDPNKWGKLYEGFMVCEPQVLLKIPKEQLHLIICNIYYREIEKQLAKMGIDQYYINVQVKEWLLDDPPGIVIE